MMQFNQAPAPRESSLGDAYDPTASYSVDDLCIHDNVLYKCIVPISGGEAWNSAHWTETNIADEISALNSKISKNLLNTAVSLTANTDFIVPADGYIRIQCGSSANQYCYAYVDGEMLLEVATGSAGQVGGLISTVFVRKGMTAKFAGTASAQAAYFELI